MGFLTRCKRPFLFAFLLQFCNMLFSFFLKTFLILFEKQQLGCVLEVFLARRESIWPGLALPILAGLYAVVMALSYTAAPDTPWNQVLGGVLAVFLVSGIPAFLLLMVFFICRSGRRRKKQLEKMNVQDL